MHISRNHVLKLIITDHVTSNDVILAELAPEITELAVLGRFAGTTVPERERHLTWKGNQFQYCINGTVTFLGANSLG